MSVRLSVDPSVSHSVAISGMEVSQLRNCFLQEIPCRRMLTWLNSVSEELPDIRAVSSYWTMKAFLHAAVDHYQDVTQAQLLLDEGLQCNAKARIYTCIVCDL